MTRMRIGCAVLAALGVAASAAAQQPAADSPALVPIRQSLAMEIQEDGGARPSFARDIDYIALVARAPGILIHGKSGQSVFRLHPQISAVILVSDVKGMRPRSLFPNTWASHPLERDEIDRLT